MASEWDALRQSLLYVGWPGLILTSTYAIVKAAAFYRSLRHSAPGLLVLLTICGWTVTLATTAFVTTLYLGQSPAEAGPVVLPVFVLWAGSMVTIVWVVQRWGAETATLDTYYGEVERMERMKSGFINHVAHELNTPITPLRMQLAMFKKEALGPLTERQVASLDKMERNVDRLSGLVEQVLMASRIQAGNMRVEVQSADIATILQEVAALLPEGRVQVEAASGTQATVDPKHTGYALEALLAHVLRSQPVDAPVEVSLQDGSTPVVDIRHHGDPVDPRHFRMFHDPIEAATRDGLALELFNVHGLLSMQGADVRSVSPGHIRIAFRHAAPPPRIDGRRDGSGTRRI